MSYVFKEAANFSTLRARDALGVIEEASKSGRALVEKLPEGGTLDLNLQGPESVIQETKKTARTDKYKSENTFLKNHLSLGTTN